MIVIFEGIERTGKTTMCKELEKRGFIYIKDMVRTDVMEPVVMDGRLDAVLSSIKAINNSGKDVVIDRLHISELVYRTVTRTGAYDYNSASTIHFVDSILSEMGAKLILMTRETDEEYLSDSFIKSKKEIQNTISERFMNEFEKSEIKDKHTFNFEYSTVESIIDEIVIEHPVHGETNNKTVSEIAEDIIQSEKLYNFYLASPFFNDEQTRRMNVIKNILRDNRYDVYAPFENDVVGNLETPGRAETIFNSNLNAILHSKAVIAITDGKDMGTIWEAGYAYGKGIPVIYFAETLGEKPFNLMLSQSGCGIAKSWITLMKMVEKNDFTYKDKVTKG